MSVRRFASLAMAGLLLAAGGLPAGRLPVARAAEYTLETAATYDVRPAEARVDVSVEVDFTNTTPDPEGQFSVFDEIKLAVQDGVSEATATDAEGDLDVTVAVENEVNVATIVLREGLRFDQTTSLTLSYALVDGADPAIRVRPSVVVFPAWGFGTASSVRVTLPAGFEASVDGDVLTLEDGALVSGPIADPTQWLAVVTAAGDTAFTPFTAAVPLAGGTADVEVRAFADDAAWGERTLALLERALPLIEEEIGLPYPRLAPLIVTQTVAADRSGFSESDGGTELLVAFDQPEFTVVHQVTHLWLSEALIADRWIREGLASDVAARVAGSLEVELPFDPVTEAEARNDAAFPLAEWSVDAGPEGETWGYAASWAFVEALDQRLGPDVVPEVLARVVAGIGPFRQTEVSTDLDPAAVADPAVPLATRSFLDHLQTLSGVDLGDVFAADVLGAADVALLPARADARTALDTLVVAGGDWEAPDPVLGAMTAWTFDAATEQIEAAAAWLAQRDVLLDEMADAGLRAPERLRQAYRSYGGGPEAIAELEAQRAVVDAYAQTAERVNAERSFVERIGMVGGPDPADQLALANGRFAEGDLTGAVDAIAEAQRIVEAAGTGGIVRIASAALIAIILLVLAALLYRRRASYTAAP